MLLEHQSGIWQLYGTYVIPGAQTFTSRTPLPTRPMSPTQMPPALALSSTFCSLQLILLVLLMLQEMEPESLGHPQGPLIRLCPICPLDAFTSV